MIEAIAQELPQQKEKPEIYYSLLKYFARFTQFITWPFAFVFFNFLFRLKINGRENLNKISAPFLIISNHVAFYDSFVFRLVLGAFTNKLPLRFMAVNSFRTWYLNFLSRIFFTDVLYMIFGVFVVVKGRGIDKNLAEAVRIIKNGGNIVMFPEGSIMQEGKIEPFKLGAATLVKKTGVNVLPISMYIEKGDIRRKYVINIGEPIVIDQSMDVNGITDIFYKNIVKLHNQK